MANVITEQTKDEIAERIMNGEKYATIATECGVSLSSVYRVVHAIMGDNDSQAKKNYAIQSWLMKNWRWKMPKDQPKRKSNFRTPYTCQRHPWGT